MLKIWMSNRYFRSAEQSQWDLVFVTCNALITRFDDVIPSTTLLYYYDDKQNVKMTFRWIISYNPRLFYFHTTLFYFVSYFYPSLLFDFQKCTYLAGRSGAIYFRCECVRFNKVESKIQSANRFSPLIPGFKTSFVLSLRYYDDAAHRSEKCLCCSHCFSGFLYSECYWSIDDRISSRKLIYLLHFIS